MNSDKDTQLYTAVLLFLQSTVCGSSATLQLIMLQRLYVISNETLFFFNNLLCFNVFIAIWKQKTYNVDLDWFLTTAEKKYILVSDLRVQNATLNNGPFWQTSKKSPRMCNLYHMMFNYQFFFQNEVALKLFEELAKHIGMTLL